MKKHIIKCDGVTQIVEAIDASQAKRKFIQSNPLANKYASMTIKVK